MIEPLPLACSEASPEVLASLVLEKRPRARRRPAERPGGRAAEPAAELPEMERPIVTDAHPGDAE